MAGAGSSTKELGIEGHTHRNFAVSCCSGVLCHGWGTRSTGVSPAEVVIVLPVFEQLLESWVGHPCAELRVPRTRLGCPAQGPREHPGIGAAQRAGSVPPTQQSSAA